MSIAMLTSADGLDEAAEDADLVVLFITRREVESGRIGDIVDRLMCLSDRADFVRKFAHRVSLVVDGYNDDPRELFEIPAVVALFRAIDGEWPFWFHFMALHDRSFDTAFMLLLDTERRPAAASQPVRFTFDQQAFRATLLAKVRAMNNLQEAHRLNPEEASAISDAALGRIDEILQ